MDRPPKVLQVTAADVTVKVLLLPLVNRLWHEGYEVHIACSDGRHARRLIMDGYRVHAVPIDRRIAPWSNLRSLLLLYRLMRKEKYDIVHVHTPVAAVVGRIAAWLARVPAIVYTAHGFYFHDRMPEYKRKPIIWLERVLGHITGMLFTQSKEDADTAVRERIYSRERVLWIGNGVDVARFRALNGNSRSTWGLHEADRVVGFAGRLVREKGIVELIQAVHSASKVVPNLKLLLVGDTLESDRDRGTKGLLQRLISRNGLGLRVIFTGFVEDMAGCLSAMDVLVLPSYRDGMPRTIIEAMACGKAVVASDIRGCREEVVHRVTGLLVPPKDSTALARVSQKAFRTLLTRTGEAGHSLHPLSHERVHTSFFSSSALVPRDKEDSVPPPGVRHAVPSSY